MGTRSWNESLEKFCIGEPVYVKASNFDSGSEDKKYSDFLKFKEATLLEEIILSVHRSSV